MDAASFNFVAVDVPQAWHLISVQARIDTTGSAGNRLLDGVGTVGKGSMTVESVRLIKDPNVPWKLTKHPDPKWDGGERRKFAS